MGGNLDCVRGLREHVDGAADRLAVRVGDGSLDAIRHGSHRINPYSKRELERGPY